MLRFVLLLTLAAPLLMAQTVMAELKHYNVIVDEFQNTPGTSPSFEFAPAGEVGQLIIRDKADGSPTLVNLRIHMPYEEDIVNIEPFTMLPGARTANRASETDMPGPNQAGTGSTSSTLTWGTLTGWTKTGFAFCQESPASLLNVLCAYAGWVSGVTLNPAPSRAGSYESGTWTFAGDMSTFNGPKFLYQTFVGGTNNDQWKLRGDLASIPALPLLGAAALGATLIYLGVNAVRRS